MLQEAGKAESHAVLHRLGPNSGDMVGGAEHGEQEHEQRGKEAQI